MSLTRKKKKELLIRKECGGLIRRKVALLDALTYPEQTELDWEELAAYESEINEIDEQLNSIQNRGS